MEIDFDLWLEFEQIVGGLDDYCNVLITLDDGRRFAFNVWTFAFLAAAMREGDELAADHLRHRYLLPPDLFVERLERVLITEVIADLIRRQAIPAHGQHLPSDADE